MKFETSDTATIVITTTFACEYAGGTGTDCRVYTFGFTYDGATAVKNFIANPGSPSTDPC